MPKVRPAVPPDRRALLYACFVASGAAGLILEIVWSKYLSLLLGNSIYAVSTVVAAFLGGLGIGAVLGGSLAGRLREPLVAYASVELIVGAVGLASPAGYLAARPVFTWLYGALGGSGVGFLTIRFTVLFAVLLLPTIAMGATLPLLASEFDRRGAVFASSVGRLYALNTAGAVGGVLAAGFVLIPVLGLWKTAAAASALDFAVALAIGLFRPAATPARALSAAETAAARSSAGGAGRGAASAQNAARVPLFGRLIVPVFALSGFTAILYEIAWTRILTVPLGGMVYAFSSILALYLLGLAVGSAVVARLRWALGAPVVLFGIFEIALAVAVGAGAHLFGALPLLQTALIAASGQSTVRLFLGEAGIISLVVLAPAFCLGALFPAAAAIYKSGSVEAGSAVGAIYAANTAGSIGGSLLTGFVLIPLIGSLGSILFAAAINLAIGLAALLLGEGARRTRFLGAIGVVGAGVFFIAFGLPRWNAQRMNVGLTRLLRGYRLKGEESIKQFLRQAGTPDSAETLVFYREGRLATVAVLETDQVRVLIVNGKPDATTRAGADMRTQVMVGHLPLLLFPAGQGAPASAQARDICIVGYGSGVTMHSVLTHSVREALTVELEAAVIEAAPYFSDAAFNPLSDRRSRLVLEDAGSFLRSTSRRFDVIASEPTNPWIAGVGDLFTTEFYEAASSRLAPGGVFCQWVQLYEVSTSTLETIFRTLASRFPSGQVFHSGSSNDLVIVAARDGEVVLDPDRLRSAFGQGEIARDLARVGISSSSDLLRYYRGRLDRLAREAGPGPINTDDNGWLEHRAPLDLLAPPGQGEQKTWSEHVAEDLAVSLGPDPAKAAALLVEAVDRAVAVADVPAAQMFRAALKRMGSPEAESVRPQVEEADRRAKGIERARSLLKEAVPLLSRAAKGADKQTGERLVAMLSEAEGLDPSNGEIVARLGAALITARRPDEAVPVLRRALGLLPEKGQFRARRDLAIAEYFRRNFEQSLHELDELDRLQPGSAGVRYWRARVYQDRGDRALAKAEVQAGLRDHPDDRKLKALQESLGP